MKLIPSNTKWCGGCKQRKPTNEFAICRTFRDGLQTQCKRCNSKASNEGHKKRRGYYNDYQNRWRKAGGNQTFNTSRRDRYQELRLEFIQEYGGKCSCPGCSETLPEFLTMEHSRHDGKAHRKKTGSSLECYSDLKKRGWPKDEGIVVMCMNCNWATRFGAVCPHVREGEIH